MVITKMDLNTELGRLSTSLSVTIALSFLILMSCGSDTC